MGLEWKPIVSSNLAAAAYDPESQELLVKFKNSGAYRCEKPVIPAVWAEFEKEFDGEEGRSAGKFFNSKLKPLGFVKVQE